MNSKDKIIKKLSVNMSIISTCLLGGYVLSRDINISSDDIFLISGLVITNISSNTILIKRYIKQRKKL